MGLKSKMTDVHFAAVETHREWLGYQGQAFCCVIYGLAFCLFAILYTLTYTYFARSMCQRISGDAQKVHISIKIYFLEG